MKHMKNFLSALISLFVIAALFTNTAYAENDTYTIAVRNETEGYTYEAYQIFSGTYANGKLADITWGSGITEAGKTALYSKYSIPASNQTAEAVAEAIVNETSLTKAHDLAALLNTTDSALTSPIAMPYSESIVIGEEAAFKGYTAQELHAGYYLVLNKAVPGSAGNVYSDYIVELVNDVAVEPKSEKPSSLKKVQDINDSDETPTLSALQDSADYDIGDRIPFTLTATLPADYDKYEQYYLKFEDDMSKGLTLDTSTVRIHYGVEHTTGAEVEFAVSTDSSYIGGKVYTYIIPDLKSSRPALVAGDVISITYEAVLNKNAVIGSAGNPNKYRIEFSNNPNNSGSEGPKGTTPWDVNTVFTYQTIFNKTDTDHQALTGADFKLEKLVNGSYVDVTSLGSGTNRPIKTGTTAGSTFTFSGLGDGDYRLTEITTPAGYNTISPITFTISASHDVTSDTPSLTALTGTDGAQFTMTPDVTNGSLTAEIVNKSGIALPSTGGTGTALFKLAAVTVLIAAGIFFVKSGRKES